MEIFTFSIATAADQMEWERRMLSRHIYLQFDSSLQIGLNSPQPLCWDRCQLMQLIRTEPGAAATASVCSRLEVSLSFLHFRLSQSESIHDHRLECMGCETWFDFVHLFGFIARWSSTHSHTQTTRASMKFLFHSKPLLVFFVRRKFN